MVSNGAGIAVVTAGIVGGMLTSHARNTRIVSAAIAVIAIQDASRHTFPVYALITGGTGVAVVAQIAVGLVRTPRFGGAGFIGAGIPVIAVGRRARYANTILASVVDSTCVTVTARPTIVGRNQAAVARLRVAHRLQTGSISPSGLGADNDRVGVDGALVGQHAHVTHQRPVALVAIFQGTTIPVLLAIARYRHPCALRGFALVSYGARVAIVTFGHIGLVDTAARFVTGIIGAWVIIITVDLLADAQSGLAVVGDGAGIAVLAFVTLQSGVFTARLPQAEVLSTVVVVITEFTQLPLFQRRLVHIAITVVIDAVAVLGPRHQRITVGQTILRADPLTGAGSEFTGDLAGR